MLESEYESQHGRGTEIKYRKSSNYHDCHNKVNTYHHHIKENHAPSKNLSSLTPPVPIPDKEKKLS